MHGPLAIISDSEGIEGVATFVGLGSEVHRSMGHISALSLMQISDRLAEVMQEPERVFLHPSDARAVLAEITPWAKFGAAFDANGSPV